MQKEKHRSNATAGAYLCPQNLSQTVFDKMAYCQEDKQHILKAVIKEKKMYRDPDSKQKWIKL